MSAPPAPTDADLLSRAAAGDRDAFAALYERHQAPVYRFARAMTGRTDIAEEITQEVFITLMLNLHRYDSGRAGMTTYLYGIARNLTRNRLRRERRLVHWDPDTAPAPPADLQHDPGTVLTRAREVARLRLAIAALPSRLREVVILAALHGRSYAEVGVITGVPTGTVRSRLSRAKQMLGRVLQAPLRQAI